MSFTNTTTTLPSNDSSNLASLHAHRSALFTPVIGYISCLMIIGVIGNILVFIIYSRQSSLAKKTSTYYLIMSLAVLDLSMCAVCMPFEIVFMYFSYNFEYSALCKAAVFFCLYLNFASMTMLIIIAFDRFRKVSKPLNPVTVRETKYQIAIGMVVGLLPAWPAILVYGINEKYLPDYDVTTSYCGTEITLVGTHYPKIYHASVAVLHVVALVIIIVVYSCLRRRVHTLNKTMSRRLSQVSTNSNTDAVTERRMTRIFVTISILFIISYIPTLLLVILHDYDKYPSLAAEVAYEIFRRAYFINNAVNPIIYCFLNPRFRMECVMVLKDIVKKCGHGSSKISEGSKGSNDDVTLRKVTVSRLSRTSTNMSE